MMLGGHVAVAVADEPGDRQCHQQQREQGQERGEADRPGEEVAVLVPDAFLHADHRVDPAQTRPAAEGLELAERARETVDRFMARRAGDVIVDGERRRSRGPVGSAGPRKPGLGQCDDQGHQRQTGQQYPINRIAATLWTRHE